MSSSEANLIPANNSVAIEDVYNNNDEIPATNDKILIPCKRDSNDNDIFQLEEVIREKKKHSMTSNALATKKVTQ